MSAAQLDMLPLQEGSGCPLPPEAAVSGSAALRRQAAERLAAHRQRRAAARQQAQQAAHQSPAPQPRLEPRLESRLEHSRTDSGRTTPQPRLRNRAAASASVASAVAERYAQSPSYRAFLAEESHREVQRAAAAAEVAARHAEALAQAQSDLLAELDMWTAPQAFTPETAQVVSAPKPQDAAGLPAAQAPAPSPATSLASPAAPPSFQAAFQDALETLAARADETEVLDSHLSPNLTPHTDRPLVTESVPFGQPVTELSAGGYRVKLYEDLGRQPLPSPTFARTLPDGILQLDQAELEELDHEIAFRKEPVFQAFAEPAEPLEFIPANLLEFPRQLVAAKKMRPRLAEGPLLDEAALRSPQLRIFEVEAEPATAPAATSAVPEWSSIWLDAQAAPAHGLDPDMEADPANLSPSLLPPMTAPLARRFMAALVDLTAIGAGALTFAAVAAYAAGEVPRGLTAALIAAGALPLLGLLYLLLFFSLNGQTPGMRYARIGLCTFSDENPSRAAMRRPILATVVAAAPLGLGLLWVWLDDDRLGWQDRISRMYQRAY